MAAGDFGAPAGSKLSRSSLPLDPNSSNSNRQSPDLLCASTYSVPFPFGPETGIANSARPDSGVTSTLPDTNQPFLSGSPKRFASAGLDSAIPNASLVTSELLIIAKARIAPESASPSQTATTAFQCLRSQFRCGLACVFNSKVTSESGLPAQYQIQM
jgi:hypothetical protein